MANFLFTYQVVDIPEKYQINYGKCSHKCINYYSYTCKGLSALYIIPAFFLITKILSVVKSTRSFEEIEPENKKLRVVIFLFFILGSLVTGYFVKKALETFS